jgi:DNA-binding LytR/AlgR family response regulator
MTIDCIIVEDEPLAMERTKNFIAKIPELHLKASFENAIDAMSYLGENEIDLIFLDIKMDEISGIQFLESVKVNAEVVITTAYDEYALKGYDLNVTDYLLKPFTLDRFIQSIEKVKHKISDKTASDLEFVFIKTENRLEKINIDEVLYVEGMGDYRRIHCSDKKIMTLQTYSELEELFPKTKIVRVHKSYMVALDKIDSIERSRIRIQDEIIPISDTYRESFFSLIQ